MNAGGVNNGGGGAVGVPSIGCDVLVCSPRSLTLPVLTQKVFNVCPAKGPTGMVVRDQ